MFGIIIAVELQVDLTATIASLSAAAPIAQSGAQLSCWYSAKEQPADVFGSGCQSHQRKYRHLAGKLHKALPFAVAPQRRQIAAVD